MQLKKARQLLKSFADDTRLRIINLLNYNEGLSVTELCQILNKNQSNLSKHLARLLLTGVAGDKRKGLNVYYYLIKPREKAHRELLNAVTAGLDESKTFRQDIVKLKKIRKEGGE